MDCPAKDEKSTASILGCPTKLGFDLIRLFTVHLASLPYTVPIRTWGLLKPLDYAVFHPKCFGAMVQILMKFVFSELRGGRKSMENQGDKLEVNRNLTLGHRQTGSSGSLCPFHKHFLSPYHVQGINSLFQSLGYSLTNVHILVEGGKHQTSENE